MSWTAKKEGSCTKESNMGVVASDPVASIESKEMAEYRETYYQAAVSNPVTSHEVVPVSKPPTSKHLEIHDLESMNPLNIPSGMIRDWLEVRRAKRIPVTFTAWNRLNNQLGKCDDPVEAFEIMVTHGWSSLNHT